MRLLPSLLLGTMLLASCRTRAAHSDPGRGDFTASWIGTDTGKLGAKPRAYWCPDVRRLELFAEKGDAGMGLVVYPVKGPEAGRYPAFDLKADSVRRPGAAAAVRWFTERSMVAYQSDSGGLDLSRNGEALAGTFGFRMRGLSEDHFLRLTGRFSGVIAGACPTDSVPSPAHPQ